MKPINFKTYKELQKMSFNQACRWVKALYEAAYNDGAQSSTTVVHTIEPSDCTTVIENNDLYDLLLSVDGVDEKIADAIMAKMEDAGINYDLWDEVNE